jgi:YbbR domain-containing protein
LGTSAETAVIVKKANTKLTVDSMTNSTNLIVSLMDEQGNPVNGTSISVDMKGINNYTTDSKGQINIPTDNLAPGNYNVKIKFNGNKIMLAQVRKQHLLLKNHLK